MKPVTVRGHLEAIRDMPLNLKDEYARERSFRHALDALDILDNAECLSWCDDGSKTPLVRLIPDPPTKEMT